MNKLNSRLFENNYIHIAIKRLSLYLVILSSPILFAADEPVKSGSIVQKAGTEETTGKEVSVAILPFEDKTGSENYSYLADSIMDAVGNAMGKKFKFKAIDTDRVKEQFPDNNISKRSNLDMIKSATVEMKADVVIFGDYIYNDATKQVEITAQMFFPVIKTNKQLKKINNPVDNTLFGATAKVADLVIQGINSMVDAPKTGSATANVKKELTAEAIIKKNAELSSTGRFTENTNGTVTDNLRSLLWQKCSSGLEGDSCDTGEIAWMNWKSGTELCQNMKLAGKSWRLPTLDELQSIIKADSTPAINRKIFPGTMNKNYWSSTGYGSEGSAIWYVSFFDGNAGAGSTSSLGYLRCVAAQ